MSWIALGAAVIGAAGSIAASSMSGGGGGAPVKAGTLGKTEQFQIPQMFQSGGGSPGTSLLGGGLSSKLGVTPMGGANQFGLTGQTPFQQNQLMQQGTSATRGK